ncbi:RICIN domain-containing protein [Kitasatospora sp. NBC_01250]|uniref:RICIN domain-containing protein n=1 Tax=unclassified Kitasatospora TaxID=2633591 RepID=UPI002E137A33|nr:MULTISPECIES: RICIN domain-containing protein [unclassified Kitasatospora]WSJ66344.1 RICIN domain-containing protein [Kitasatospora sp. NBC_01302]
MRTDPRTPPLRSARPLGRSAPAAVLALCFALCLALLVGRAQAAPAPATPAAPGARAALAPTAITVDGTSPGRTFDGVGAISGGGGNSRLLLDYPEPQRSQILDYLFKPGYGAALQILKAEVGGDTNSTDGAESSIEHTRGTIDCNNGYEWWLMEQAKARNPAIKLYALSWGAPGWIGNGNFWSQDMIDYLMSWLGCAKQHGLSIDYLGGWNERGYNATWYENLHAALAANGYGSTQVVGADDTWAIATSMRSDSALNGAVDIVGTHYPCGYMSAMTSCSSTADALATGKPLWASENGSEDADTGAGPIVRGINRGYLDAKLTAFINWPVVAALYPNLGFNTMGLVTANQPWSGAYAVGRSAWAIAQTTQFTAPGWQYLDTASGYLGGNRANGSYVSYAAPDRSAWSTVIEALDATAPQTVTLNVTGGLPAGALHVWSTDFSSNYSTDHLVPGPDLTPSAGGYQLTLQPGHVYTVTTTTGQGAGTATSPQRGLLALPYQDSLAGTGTGQEARYFSAMNGAFETEPCAGGRPGNCLQQQARTTPIRWTDETGDQPYTTMGDLSWTNYTVSADVLLQQSGTAELLGRVGTQGRNNGGLNAYNLRVGDNGAWTILKDGQGWSFTTLASGTVAPLGLNTWHHVELGFQGSTLTARLDGVTLGSVTDSSYGAGQIALGTGGYYNAQFSNLAITPGTSTALDGTYNLVNGNSGQLLDASNQGTADGTPIIQWTGNGGSNQQWRLTSTGDGYYTITGVGSGKALDVPNITTVPATQLDLWTPNGGTNQQWLVVPAGGGRYTLESRSDGELVDVSGASLTMGAPAIQWPPNGGANQTWQLAPVG